MRNKADAFEAISTFLIKNEFDDQPSSLLLLNSFRKWRRRFIVKHSLREKLNKFVRSIQTVKKSCDDRYVRLMMYFFKHNVQEWRLKAALCKAVLERQDFRRIRAFKILQNFAKLGRLFFKVVLAGVLRKEHFHRQVFFIRLKQIYQEHDAETRRMGVGALDLFRIQKAAAYTKLQKPLISLFSRGLQSQSSSFNKLRFNAFETAIEGSRWRTDKAVSQISILKSKNLRDNPVLYSLVSGNMFRRSTAAGRVLCSVALKVLKKANEEKNKEEEYAMIRHAAKFIHGMRNMPKEALSNLLIDKRSEFLLQALNKKKDLLKEIDASNKRHFQIENETYAIDQHALVLKQRRAFHWLGLKKLYRAWNILLDWRFVSELNEIKKEKASRNLILACKNIVTRNYQESVWGLMREARNNKNVDKMRKKHWRRLKKGSFKFWALHSKRGAAVLRKVFGKIFENYKSVEKVAFKKLKFKVVGEHCRALLDQIEIMNESIAEANQKLLEQTQDNFQLENDLRYRNTRNQRSLIRFIMKASEIKRLYELRMCLFDLSTFANFTRRSTYLLTAVARAFTKNTSGAFYLIQKEAINDLERFLVQAVKNFREETAEQMIEREDLNQQTLSFVEERGNFEITTQNQARRLKIASQEAAFKALEKAKRVEERAVMKARLQMWKGKRRRLEILKGFVDYDSKQFADRKYKDYIRRWHHRIVKVKKFRQAFERLIHFVRHVERNNHGFGMRLITDRSFEMEQVHLGKLIEQAEKRIFLASESDLRSKLNKMTSLVIRLIESRKYRLFQRFFDITIYDHKRKLIANTKIKPFAEKQRLRVISDTFKLYKKKYQSTQTRNKIYERTLTRQKLFLLKLLQANVADQRQVKMTCRYFDSVIGLIQETRLRAAFSNLTEERIKLRNKERAQIGGLKLLSATSSVFTRHSFLQYTKVFRYLSLPRKAAFPLGVTLQSLIKRKLIIAFAILKAKPPNDNIMGRYLVAKFRRKKPLSNHELISRSFFRLKSLAQSAGRKRKAAKLVLEILEKRYAPQVYLHKWNFAAQMDGMMTKRATPEEILNR